MDKTVLRLLSAVLPLTVVPLWAYLIAEGTLDFGGGEKDILLVVPMLAWAILYLIISLCHWRRPIAQASRRALFGATLGLMALWGGLWAFSALGVA